MKNSTQSMFSGTRSYNYDIHLYNIIKYIYFVNNIPEYTVSQLNKSIKDLLEENYSYLKLVGEAGSITIANSGHVKICKFKLKRELNTVFMVG